MIVRVCKGIDFARGTHDSNPAWQKMLKLRVSRASGRPGRCHSSDVRRLFLADTSLRLGKPPTAEITA